MSSDFNLLQPWNAWNNYLNPQNPADSAMGYYNQIPGMLQNVYGPYLNNQSALNNMNAYINNGTGAFNSLNQYLQNGTNAGNALNLQYARLTQNPGGFLNQMGQSFHQSPGFAFQTQQALQAANRAAAASGMAGSPAEQQNIAGVTNQLANQDYYNYLGHAMNLYNQGLSGMQNMYGLGASVGQNIYDTGANLTGNMYDTNANMANQYAQNLGAAYMNQGNLAYTGDINQQMMQGQRLGSLMGMLGGFASGGLF